MVLAVVASLGAPAAAGGKKKISDSFGASLAPFPNYSSHTSTERPGCTAGEENVHWVAKEFTAPAKGSLRLYMEGFTGDHDVYIFSNDLVFGTGAQAQVPDGAPPEEEVTVPVKAQQTLQLVACNWLGQPEVEAHYEFTFTK
jgi:hypothetical protein